jgi:hypothetical protein
MAGAAVTQLLFARCSGRHWLGLCTSVECGCCSAESLSLLVWPAAGKLLVQLGQTGAVLRLLVKVFFSV